MTESLKDLIGRSCRPGRVTWLGLRPARRETMVAVAEVEIDAAGLVGDRRDTPGRRAVTLIQAEHLPVIAALAGRGAVAPGMLRRNIVVAEINLLGLRGRRFRIGTAVLEGTGPCAPCSRMEAALGFGGYAAVRGHGGITACVIAPGRAAVGDALTPLAPAEA